MGRHAETSYSRIGTRKGVMDVKIARKLAVLGAVVTMLVLPATANAQGGGCFGKSVQRFHTTFMGAATSGDGVPAMLDWIRQSEETFPWCQ